MFSFSVTLPNFEKISSRSVLLVLNESPVTNKLSPGFISSSSRLYQRCEYVYSSFVQVKTYIGSLDLERLRYLCPLCSRPGERDRERLWERLPLSSETRCSPINIAIKALLLVILFSKAMQPKCNYLNYQFHSLLF
jgi:hypothetical protein